MDKNDFYEPGERHGENQCTRFPILHSHEEGSFSVSDTTLTSEAVIFKLPEATGRGEVISAWANLLHEYTGNETVIFCVDEEAVCVNIHSMQVNPIGVHMGEAGTAIYFTEKLPVSSNSVVLHVHQHMNDASISMDSNIPLRPQALIDQFLHILTKTGAPVANPSILNPNPMSFTGPELLHDLIEYQSTNSANRAIEFRTASGTIESCTYTQLQSVSDDLATKLHHKIAGETDGIRAIPILLPQSLSLYAAIIAILKSGAAFVPFNIDAPQDRVKFLCQDVNASVVVTNTELKSRFDWEGSPCTIIVDDLFSSLDGTCMATKSPAVDIMPSDPAYIMYTSGSTGTPKGVVVPHRAATQSLLAHDQHIPPFERFLQFASPTFDVSVFEIFFPLFRGRTLVACDRSTMLSNLTKIVNDLDIDAAELTPTVAGELLQTRDRVPGLKVLLTIGEMLTRPVIEAFGDGMLQAMYGPTEAAIHCTLATNIPKQAKVGDIGVPLNSVSAFILAIKKDPTDIEVRPMGWIGELAVGGHQLADGYLNRPEATAAAFIDSQYGRLYRTGDRARMLSCGRIEMLGRISEGQVKLRGQRIELGEIETVAAKTEDVKTAIANVVDGTLVVHVSSSNDISPTSVKGYCAKWLPSFMVPSDVVVRKELPRLPSGKVDRKRLQQEYRLQVQRDAHSMDSEGSSLDPTEQIICQAVKDLIGRWPGKTESLVSLGLDSLMAIRLVSKLRTVDLHIDVFNIIKADTVESIAEVVRRGAMENQYAQQAPHTSFELVKQAAIDSLPTSLHGEVEDIIPCTSLQEGMIVETLKDNSAYCNWLLLELPSDVDETRVRQAITQTIQRHQILRTGFLPLEDGFAQVIWKSSRLAQFKVLDSVQSEWTISLDGLLHHPFSVGFLAKETGEKLLNVFAHHVVYDGWSWEIVQADFQRILSGEELIDPAPQFRAVVEWEKSITPDVIEESLHFWEERLQKAGETLLPTSLGMACTTASPKSQTHLLSTPRKVLEGSARASGVSVHVLAQAAWSVLLGSYTGKDDIAFGTVLSGRTIAYKNIEFVVGPTISTLPIRAHLDRGTPIRSLVNALHRLNRDILQHTVVDLRKIRSRVPEDGVFDTLFVWQQTANTFEETTVRLVNSQDRLEFKLLVEFEPKGDHLNIKATYKDNWVSDAQVTVLLRQLDAMVEKMVLRPDDAIESLTQNMEPSLLSINNPIPSYEPISSRTLATVFEETAARTPQETAVQFTSQIENGAAINESISYEELNSGSNKLARYLQDNGVRPDDLVAVCMEKSIVCYKSILAIVKAGAGYLPLTPDTPSGRIKRILSDARVRFILCSTEVDDAALPEGVERVVVQTLDLESVSADNLDVDVSASCLAYAVFTSGSTGVPKGVLVEHAQIVSNLDILAEMYPVCDGDAMLQFCSISFDVSVFEIFFAWRRGMKLCSATKDVLLRNLEDAINAMCATHLSMTPTVAALVHPENVPNVKFLVTSGEAVTKKVFGDWADHGLWQGYGPSETTNICSINPKVKREHNISNIGPPFRNTSAFVVDPDAAELVILPRGAVGELCFGGSQVCRGYLNMEELTASKFIDHPEYGRIYRSGDIGRCLPTGEIIIQGRQDDQVKVRGNRVELGEITAVLFRHKKVKDAVTLAIKVGDDEQVQLVAFVVVHEEKVITDELIATTKSLLPPYMVPSEILQLSAIPMTHQGKTDKRALQKIFFDRERRSDSNEVVIDKEDWSADEKMIAQVVAEITKVPESDINHATSLFRLGIDSISAIYLSNKLSKRGFLRLDVSQIMANPTIAALATLIKRSDNQHSQAIQYRNTINLDEFSASVKNHVLNQVQGVQDLVLEILPCTPLQEAMLGSSGGSVSPWNHTLLELLVPPDRLRKAWEAVVVSHDILRTCFVVTSHPKHAYAQVILKSHEMDWREREVEAMEQLDGAIDEHLESVAKQEDVTRPPYVLGAFTLPERTVLVMSFHHALYDGVALDMLFNDVEKTCIGDEAPPRTPFAPFLEYIENVDYSTADQYWAGKLDGFEPSAFPNLTGKSSEYRKNLKGMTSSRRSCSISLESIDKHVRDQSSTILALGQTAWAKMLSGYTGERDICFGNVVSGRAWPVDGVESIVAPTFNTVPVRITISPEDTNATVVSKAQEANIEAMPYQAMPLRRILKLREMEGERLFDTLFILQHRKETDGAGIWKILEERGEMDFSVVVEIIPRVASNSLDLVIHFWRNMVLEKEVNVLLDQLDSAIASILSNPDDHALKFDSWDSKLLAVSSKEPIRIEPTRSDLLHSHFELNAQALAYRSALEFLGDNGTYLWTYQQLNSFANELAHFLFKRGVQLEDSIPVCMEKKPAFYVCILGVLKAGGVFTPIDPKLPKERISFMINELQAKLVLTDTISLESIQNASAESTSVIDVEALDLSQHSDENPNVAGLTDKCLAYRIYTSGSTGQPKAVSIEHRSAVQTFHASRSLLPWDSSTRLLNYAAPTFDMCYYDCFLAWAYGFTLCSATRPLLLGDLENTIQKIQVTMLDLTPTIAGTLNPDNLPTVKTLYCIGETMSQQVVHGWEGRCVNSYGPTEAAMCCTITPVSREISPLNIGRPFDTTKFVLLEKAGTNIVPVFGTGELCIAGFQLAREYHNNSQLTETKFIELNGERLYRTGDIARMLPDGTFEFIGRADDQIKIRGLRVELDEVNATLKKSSPEIVDVTTLVLRQGSESKEQLVSFIVSDATHQEKEVVEVVSNTEICIVARRAAERFLPRYMVPGVILAVSHIPRSAAGKKDSKPLAKLFREYQHPVEKKPEKSEAWTSVEATIREVLAELSSMPIERISKTTTIYEIGLDSISAVQVAALLKQRELKLSVIDVLERPSIQRLGELVNEREEEKAPVMDSNLSLPPMFQKFRDHWQPLVTSEWNISSTDLEGVYPCTATQEGMLSQFVRSHGELYFNTMVFRIPSSVSLNELQNAWETVVNAYPILRMAFAEISDDKHSYAMVTFRPGVRSIRVQELEVVREDWKKSVRLHATESAQEALHNPQLPPWRIGLLREMDGDAEYMVFSGHHALYDATSLQLIFKALKIACNRDAGKENIKSSSFVPTAAAIIEASSEMKAQDFWKSYLQGSSICRLPNLCPLREQSTAFHVRELRSIRPIPELEKGCKSLGVSLPAATQATWVRVLAAYMGEPTITTGIVLSGRTGLQDANDVPFPCVVTLPSVANLIGTNGELARAIQSSNASMLKYQHTPLRAIQRWQGHPEESLFDTIFVYQPKDTEGESMKWEVVMEEASVDYALSFEVQPLSDGTLLFKATAKNNMISPEQTELLLRQFLVVLNDILDTPDGEVSDYTRLEKDLLAITPAKTEVIPTKTKLLHQFVEEHVVSHPDRIAFEFITDIDGDNITRKTWTYKELDVEGNRVANFLHSQGVVPKTIVGISFEKCPEATFAILGVLKAGCAYVAIDYSAPVERKTFVIEDSGAVMVLTMDKYVDELQKSVSVPVISAESNPILLHSSTEHLDTGEITGDALCYCLYTSGTTGIPKGCELTHDNAIQAMLAFQRLFTPHWDDDSKWFQFASFHFDVSVLEQFWSWSVGICVTSAPRDIIFQDLPGTIKKLRITHLDLTPSLAVLLSPEDVPDLCRGVFITGGEALRQDILDKWGKIGCVYNGYGPTEVTIGCTMYPRVPENGKPSNIGPQFDNVGTFVLQPGTDRPVLRGAVGELCCSGKLVGKGYLNRPELTNEKFPILEPFGTRIYRTGDLVRILHDGTFDFLGRADDQIKLRGQRLEIGEINEVIKRGKVGVVEVATLVLRHPKQQKDQLVSFTVVAKHSHSETKPTVQTGLELSKIIVALVEVCKSKLPAYMVPTHFLPISKLPLSVNNKVDHKVLKALYEETSLEILQKLARPDNMDAWSPVEKRIRTVLEEATGLHESDISRSSTIFELGLDSVSVLGLSRKLRKAGFELATPALLMQYPMIATMAKQLDKSIDTCDVSHLEDLKRAQEKIDIFAESAREIVESRLGLNSDAVIKIAPCTALQEGMIARFLDSENTPLYFNTFSMELKDNVDVDRLKEAWRSVVQQTGTLRTCFCDTPDGYAQVVLRKFDLPIHEVESLDKGSTRAIEEASQRSWDQNRDLHTSPISITLIRTESRRILCLHIFHALYDGTSLPFILSDVVDAYNDNAQSHWRQDFIDVVPHILSINEAEAKAFWTKQVQSGSSLPTSLHQNATLHDKGYSLQLGLSEHSSDLEELCKKRNCTAQTVFQVAWAAALSSLIGDCITFGMVVSGRSLAVEGIEDLIGPTFNTIPFSIDVTGKSWDQLLRYVQDFNSASLPFHSTPLRLVQKWTTRKQLFDTLFVFQKNDDGEVHENDLWTMLEGDIVTDYSLALEVNGRTDGSFTLSLVAKSTISETTAMGLLYSTKTRIQSLLANPDGLPTTPPTPAVSANSGTPTPSARSISGDFEWDTVSNTIRSIIAALAEVDELEVTADSSILELGLDSIEAIKLSSRLRQQNIILSVSEIMRNPTIRKMISVRGNDSTSSTSQRGDYIEGFRRLLKKQATDLRDDDEVYPTTPLQEAMVAEIIASEYSRYFNHDVARLHQDINIAKLHHAFDTVIEATPILRTSFFSFRDSQGKHGYGQKVNIFSGRYWSEYNVQESELDLNVNQTITKITQKVDLLMEPPFYVTLISTPEETRMVVSIAHALYDGWSLGLLHQDIQAAYHGNFQVRPSSTPLLQNIVSVDLQQARAFWEQSLQGCVPAKIPQRQNKSSQVFRFEKRSSIMSSELQSFCKSLGITPQAVGHACWAMVLAQLVSSPEVVFGSVLWGRDMEDADKIMFPAMNTVPLRLRLTGTVKELLKSVQEANAEVLKYQHTPLREIQKLVPNAERGLFDSIFLNQLSATTNSDKQSERLYESMEAWSDTEYPIAAEMERDTQNRIIWRNACKSDYFNKTEAEQLLVDLDRALAYLIQHSDSPIITHTTRGTVIGASLPVHMKSQISYRGAPIDPDAVLEKVTEGLIGVDQSSVSLAQYQEQDVLVVFLIGEGAKAALNHAARNAKTRCPRSAAPDYIIPLDETPTDLLAVFEQMPDHVKQQYTLSEFDSEWSELELRMRAIMSKVSGLPEEDIQRTQTIFHLGLDSISAIQLSVEFRKAGFNLSVAQILREATIERMALSLEEDRPRSPLLELDVNSALQKASQPVNSASILKEFSVGEVEAILPATAGQVYMLSAWKNSNFDLFMPTFAFKTRPLNADTLKAAWESVVRHEEALHTTFRPTTSSEMPFVQVVLRNPPSQLKYHVLSHSAGGMFLSFMMKDESERPVNMMLPPVRLTAVITPSETILLLTIHHALYDGVSLPLLLERLQAQLDGEPDHRLPTPEPEKAKFTNFLASVHSVDKVKRKSFWTSYLANAESTILSRRISRSLTVKRVESFLPAVYSEAANLENRLRKQGLSLQSAFLAGFAKTYHASLQSARKDLTIAIYLSNRHLPLPELQIMAAPTLNIVPIRLRDVKNTGIVELAEQAQRDMAEMSSIENATVGLWEVEEWTGVVVDCAFNFLKLPTPTKNTDGVDNYNTVKTGKTVLHEMKVERLDFQRKDERTPKAWDLDKAVEERMRNIKTNFDVEVAVRRDAIDVGMFSMDVFYDSEELGELVRGMCKEVEQIC
ncbi:acetyl-CoA synthetase-like protein [Ascodesmis nigricans]|uniref:Acetyl-CoA synthetase-like protein n=1 Tax=Ascodesmis nigricans TaxID=341454 RepID=A0A4S2MXF2_9PEZI|nr:acetyl-CoA synthetase-like protein [Ascodesmis nigricans]